MKRAFCIILTFLTYQSYSQEYFDTDMTREKSKIKNYYLETTTLIDSTKKKPYVSSIQFFDKKGRHKIQYEFNRQRDTTESIESFYPDNLTEIDIHNYKNAVSDTAIFKYNKRNQQTVEIWKWGEENAIDTTMFFYDKQHKLIANFNIYDFGTNQDSLFYKKGRLIKSISYNPKITDSVTYQYLKNRIIGINKYDNKNELISQYDIEYGEFRRPKRITNIYKSFNHKGFDKKSITDFEYHNKKQIKSKIIKYFTNGKLAKTTEFYYSKYGFLERSKTTNSKGKVESAYKITLHNNV